MTDKTAKLKESIDKVRALMEAEGLIGFMVLVGDDLETLAKITTLQHKETLFIRDPATGQEMVDPAAVALAHSGKEVNDEMLRRMVTTAYVIEVLSEEAVNVLDMFIDLGQVTKRIRRRLGA